MDTTVYTNALTLIAQIFNAFWAFINNNVWLQIAFWMTPVAVVISLFMWFYHKF